MDTINVVLTWLMSHGVVSASMTSAIVGFVIRHYLEPWLPKVEAEAESFLNLEITKLSSPEKAMILEAAKWMDSLVPAAGDSKYASAVSLIVAKVPALAPYSAQLLQVLTDIGAAAKAIVEAEEGTLNA